MLSSRISSTDRGLNSPLCEMLVYLGDPEVATKAMAQLKAGITREQQLNYGRCLSRLEAGWSTELRGEFFEWLGQATAWRRGASFQVVLQRMRRDTVAHAQKISVRNWNSEQRLRCHRPAHRSSTCLRGGAW